MILLLNNKNEKLKIKMFLKGSSFQHYSTSYKGFRYEDYPYYTEQSVERGRKIFKTNFNLVNGIRLEKDSLNKIISFVYNEFPFDSSTIISLSQYMNNFGVLADNKVETDGILIKTLRFRFVMTIFDFDEGLLVEQDQDVFTEDNPFEFNFKFNPHRLNSLGKSSDDKLENSPISLFTQDDFEKSFKNWLKGFTSNFEYGEFYVTSMQIEISLSFKNKR